MQTNANLNKIEQLLEQVGLTETETCVYLAGYGEETVTAQELVKRTGIKRPTVYHALHTLTEKGLVSEHGGGSKTAFHMEAPVKLLPWIDQQKGQLAQKEDAVQQLVSLVATGGAESSLPVATYTNKKDVQAIFDLAFYARSKKCTLLLPSKDFLSVLDDGSRVAEAQARGSAVSVLTKKIPAALLIYDDQVVLFESAVKATVLTSATLAATLQSLL